MEDVFAIRNGLCAHAHVRSSSAFSPLAPFGQHTNFFMVNSARPESVFEMRYSSDADTLLCNHLENNSRLVDRQAHDSTKEMAYLMAGVTREA